MTAVIDGLGQALILVGAGLVLLAGIGMVRFDDPLARLHALTKASTLGVVVVFFGAALILDTANDWTSLLLAAALQVATSPISAGLISRSTYLSIRESIPTIGSIDVDGNASVDDA